MPNANLQIQIQNVMVGRDESLQTALDLDRSAYSLRVDQVLNANSGAGVGSNTDMTFIGGSSSNWAASNYKLHIRHIALFNYTQAGECRVDLYDNSTGGTNTMASIRLLSWAATPAYWNELYDLQGLIFSTGFVVGQSTNSNAVVIMGGVLRRSMPSELQSSLGAQQ